MKIKDALDKGYIPRDKEPNIDLLLYKPQSKAAVDGEAEGLDLSNSHSQSRGRIVYGGYGMEHYIGPRQDASEAMP